MPLRRLDIVLARFGAAGETGGPACEWLAK
jgi:hypothetical protein